MILPVHALVRSRLRQVLTDAFVLPEADQPAIVIETPPRRTLGDLAVPVAFELARRLRKAPRAIAQELATALGAIDGIYRIEAAPNGYLNFFIDRAAFVQKQLASKTDTPVVSAPGTAARTVIVEHTA